MLALCLTLLEGDRERALFLQAYQAYDRSLHYVARRILGSEDLAQDAVQEAWYAACRNFEKFLSIPCQKRRAWMVVIVKNLALNMLRREGRLTTLEYDPEDRRAHPDHSGDWVKELIQAMRPADRQILELRLIAGYSSPEAARLLDISVSAADQRYSRALARLKQTLREEGVYGPTALD